MKRKTELPELLAPAGSYEAMLAAVSAGADAVYLGGKSFGARAYAKNFDNETLQKTVIYCHLHGVKVYVTVNTLIYDREMKEAVSFCADLFRMGVDAIITADLGLISLVRKFVPGMEIHASTQMSLHNVAGVNEAVRLGVTRAVVARETSFDDIRAIVDGSDAEIEVFLHGALCVCHSGQCLFSSMVGGRSGNRGECAQPCRLPYNGKDSYPLSLRDLSLADHVRQLISSGAASLKIEGRMKSPDYVFRVTSVYRSLLDENRDAGKKENAGLAAVFSRGGFTDGYFTGNFNAPMTGVRSEEDKEQSRGLAGMTFSPASVPVSGEADFLAGEPSRFRITDGKTSVEVTGEIPSLAVNSPLNEVDLSTRLCKMGNTFLTLPPENLKIRLDAGLNLSPGQINALRRNAAEAFERKAAGIPDAEPVSPDVSLAQPGGKPLTTAHFFLPETLRGVRSESLAGFDAVFLPLWRFPENDGKANGIALPPVVMPHEWEEVRSQVLRAIGNGAEYALIGNLSHLALIRDTDLIPVADLRMNILNSHTAAVLSALGVSHRVLSPELTLSQTADIRGSATVCGRIPLMLTERCFVRENGGCKACGRFSLTDRMGKKFPILREFPHRNVIFNSLPTYMGDRKDALKRGGIGGGHFIFSVETSAQAEKMLTSYRKGLPLDGEVRRVKA